MDSTGEQYVINAEGQKTAVIPSIEDYEQLLEDLHDLAMVAERCPETPIRLNEMKQKLIVKEG